MFISFATPQTGLLGKPRPPLSLLSLLRGGEAPLTEVENCRRLSLALFTFLISRRPVAVQVPPLKQPLPTTD